MARSRSLKTCLTGGIPSLAWKKKTHGVSALLLIGSLSMFRLVRLSAGRSAVAGARCSSGGEAQDA
jgi:hypothetical protein